MGCWDGIEVGWADVPRAQVSGCSRVSIRSWSCTDARKLRTTFEVGIWSGLNPPFYLENVGRAYCVDRSPELQDMAHEQATANQ